MRAGFWNFIKLCCLQLNVANFTTEIATAIVPLHHVWSLMMVTECHCLKHNIRWRRYDFTSAERQRLCFHLCWFVGLSVFCSQHYRRMGFQEIFRIGPAWNMEHFRTFRGRLFQAWVDCLTFLKWGAVEVCDLGCFLFLFFSIIRLFKITNTKLILIQLPFNV